MVQTTNYQELLEAEHTQSQSESQICLWEEFLYKIHLAAGIHGLLSAKVCPFGRNTQRLCQQ